jgi:hypothetical protein
MGNVISITVVYLWGVVVTGSLELPQMPNLSGKSIPLVALVGFAGGGTSNTCRKSYT